MGNKEKRSHYESPKLEVTLTECLDIITSSIALGETDENPGYDSNGWT